MLEKLLSHSTLHAGAHVGFFSGVGMLLPMLSEAWFLHIKPWLLSPYGFYIAIGLILISVLCLGFVVGSFSKLMRGVGWMIIIPGILALVFASFGQLNAFDWADNHITGFSVVEPGVQWYVGHSVPNTGILGGTYILLGVCMLWMGSKIGKLAEHI